MRRFWTGLAMAISLAAITAGGVVITQDDAEAGEANEWIVASGAGSCTRSASPISYETAVSNGWTCGSFSGAYSAASGGDTVRVKAGDYDGQQSFGGTKTPSITLIAEEGTTVVTVPDGGGGVDGFSLNGNVDVSNVDVGGDTPFIFIGGDNSTWRDSRLLESNDSNTCCTRGITGLGAPEPILIYSDEADGIFNAQLINNVFEPQHVCDQGVGNCGAGDVYHLETIRIDQNVDGVLLESNTWLAGGEDNTSQVFITSISNPPGTDPGNCTDPDPDPDGCFPRNIIFRNNVAFNSDFGRFLDCCGAAARPCTMTFAYNTISGSMNVPSTSCNGSSDVDWVGNLGTKDSFTNCITGSSWTKNYWQDTNDTRCSGTDSWVEGTRGSLDEFNLDANLAPNAGSIAIDAGETPGASDYCTGDLGSVDRDDNPRPVGSACDVGAFERQ